MEAETIADHMGRRRALLTDRERELLADSDAQDQRYVAISRIRNKIEDELPQDVELLRTYHPKLFSELQEAVCDELVSLDTHETQAVERIRELEAELAECREQLESDNTDTGNVDLEAARDALRRGLKDNAWTPIRDAAAYLETDDD